MPLTTLLFDLDDTLYASQNGLWSAIRDRMGDYMVERLGFPPDEVPAIRHKYYTTYGTTLRGLQIHHQVDVDEYLAYVHDLPLRDFIQPDPALRTLLLSLPQPRWIFTNADANHARRVMDVLGVADCFMGIIDLRALDFVCKPNPEAYRRAMALAGVSDPCQCVMFDDAPHNLKPATELGVYTVLVGSAEPNPACRLSVTSLHELPQALPQLWAAGEG